MKTVELVINLPTSKLNTTFTYLVPPQYADQAVFGKRVLVDFGGRREEGYIVAEQDTSEGVELKPIRKVLDSEPVFDPGLLALARWMAAYYLCPLSTALNLMVPKILRKKRGRIYVAGMDELEYEQLYRQGVKLDTELLNHLWETGGLSHSQVRGYLDEQTLQQWTQQGYLTATGTYRPGRRVNRPRSYILGGFDPETELPVLRRKAPRQAAIMEQLLQDGCLQDDPGPSRLPPASLKALLNKGYIRLSPVYATEPGDALSLTDEQQEAVARIRAALRGVVRTDFLLFGVTGSGKTEVYVQAALTALQQGRGVLVLVPEIALTRQLVEVFASRFPDLAVLHSAMSAGERYEQWHRIRAGEARLVLGARSAVFAPVSNLGLIIMDEEQENTYKQEEVPRYHAREVARQRAEQASAVMILGSATPSLETYHAASIGSMQLLPLPFRIAGGSMPRVFIEDLKKSFRNDSRGYLSPLLREKIGLNLERGEQIILFINRRGHSPMTVCWECGNIASCPSCSVGMTYHSDIGENVCHYCNLHLPAEDLCPVCGGKHLQLLGAGTQRIEEHIRTLFPQAVVARLDVDSSRRKGAQKSILDRMRSGQIDILVGTQMVAKGLDFPNVSLVGVIDADGMLNLPDFRAGERCFQLLVQVAGRAGRGQSQGEVVIQTLNPEHPIIELAADQDFQGFYEHEAHIRRRLDYPPFTRLLRLVVSGEDEAIVEKTAIAAGHFIEEIIDASEADITVIGPAPCPLARIRNRHRYQLMVKCRDLGLLKSVAVYFMVRPLGKNVRIDIDFDPVSTL